jgi:CelD/BcsL family acetyltransferase involved in cellulose biosynthesis
MAYTSGSAARGMRSADRTITVQTFASLVDMPAEAKALFAVSDSLFGQRAWWDTVLSAGLSPEAMPCFVLCRLAGKPVALFPMVQDRDGGALSSLSTPYTCLFSPVLDPGLSDADRLGAFHAFGRFCRRGPVTRLDALPAEWDSLPAMAAGARKAGLAVCRFAHFGNWHEDVAGQTWSGYLAQRQGALRETIRRRLRRADRLAAARFTVVMDREGLEPAITAFEAVYARSWKEPEPFPLFNAALIRATANTGQLRLGLWHIGAEIAAAQLWVREGCRATVLKLAHDEAFKAHSPGTVLTALMLRRLLDQEAVSEIDFGRGDDPYKQGWARARRQRIGLMLFNPLRPAGLAGLTRHGLGRLRASLRGGSVAATAAADAGEAREASPKDRE